MKLIVNADDFGYSQGVNYGIIEAWKEGMVTSTTVLVTTEGTKHAFELAKKYPQLDVGIHLTLDLGIPTLPIEEIPSLVNKDGQFKSFAEWKKTTSFVEAEIYKEWKSQIKIAIENGIHPSHLDSHHHIHMMKSLFPIFQKLAEEYHLGIRFYPLEWNDKEITNTLTSIQHLKKATLFKGDFYAKNATADYFYHLPFKTDETWEIMCHPAFIDPTLTKGSSYLYERVSEFDILTDHRLQEDLKDKGIQFITFNDL